MVPKPKIAIALITKNEEQNIGSMIGRIRNEGFKDIYVVDERSTDRTTEIAEQKGIKVYQRKGTGFGCGIRSAIDIAYDKGCDFIVRLDCDGTYPPEEIHKLLEYCPSYDLIAGYRDFRKVKLLHRYPNIFFTCLARILYNADIRDINSGMKVIKVKKFHKLLDADGFDLEAQLSLRAVKNRFKIKNIRINFSERQHGKSKIKILDGFLILKRVLIERFIK